MFNAEQGRLLKKYFYFDATMSKKETAIKAGFDTVGSVSRYFSPDVKKSKHEIPIGRIMAKRFENAIGTTKWLEILAINPKSHPDYEQQVKNIIHPIKDKQKTQKIVLPAALGKIDSLILSEISGPESRLETISPMRGFTGKIRISEAESIADDLSEGRCPVRYIYGLGGMGKTQQVKKIAELLAKKDPPFQKQIMIDLRANNAVAEPLTPEQALREVLTRLEVPEIELDRITHDRQGVRLDLAALLKALQNKYFEILNLRSGNDNGEHLLLVFDNAQHQQSTGVVYTEESSKNNPLWWLLTEEYSRVAILITARGKISQHFPAHKHQSPLDRWTEVDAKEQIKHVFAERPDIFKEIINGGGARKLLNASDGIPLVSNMLLLYAKELVRGKVMDVLDILEAAEEFAEAISSPEEAVRNTLKLYLTGKITQSKIFSRNNIVNDYNLLLKLAIFPGSFDAAAAATIWSSGDMKGETDSLIGAGNILNRLLNNYGLIQDASLNNSPRTLYRLHDFVRQEAFGLLEKEDNAKDKISILYFKRAAHYLGLMAAANTLSINRDPDLDLTPNAEIEAILCRLRKHFKKHSEDSFLKCSRELVDSEEMNVGVVHKELVGHFNKEKSVKYGFNSKDTARFLSLFAGITTRACDFFMSSDSRLKWIKAALLTDPPPIEKAIHKNSEGLALRHLNRQLESQLAFEEAHKIFKKTPGRYGDWGTACTEGNLGNLAQQDAARAFQSGDLTGERGHLDIALKHYQSAFEASERVDDKIGMAQDLGNQAIIYHAQWRSRWWSEPSNYDSIKQDIDDLWLEAEMRFNKRIEIALNDDVLDYRGAANGHGNLANGLLDLFFLTGSEDLDLPGRIIKNIKDAISYHKIAGNNRGIAACSGNLGRAIFLIHLAIGTKPSESESKEMMICFDDAVRLFRQQGDESEAKKAETNKNNISKLYNTLDMRSEGKGRVNQVMIYAKAIEAHLSDRYGKLIPVALKGENPLELVTLRAKILCLEEVERYISEGA